MRKLSLVRDPTIVIQKHLLLLIVFALFSAGCKSRSQVEQSTPTPVPTPLIPSKPTYRVMRGDVERILQFTARVEPVLEEELFFKTGGRIRSVLVKRGDQVKTGQILANLETGPSNVDVRRAEINLELAKMDRELLIMQANKISEEYSIYLRRKELGVEIAQLALDEVNTEVSAAQIVAPFNGTILTLSISPDTSVEPYKTVIVLGDLTVLELTADLQSTDVQLLQEGLSVNAFNFSGPAIKLTGEIRKLPYPYGKAESNLTENLKQATSTRIRLRETPELSNLSLGDMLRIQAILERRDAAIWLPPQAIRKYEGRNFVVVQDLTNQRRIDIKIGVVTEDRVEILGGLEQGQLILAP